MALLRAVEVWARGVNDGISHAYPEGATETLCGLPLSDDGIVLIGDDFDGAADSKRHETCLALARHHTA